MVAYAIARLRTRRAHPGIVAYLERIQETLDPFSGRFLVHGGEKEVLEGEWDGSVVVIEFPGLAEARDWYRSPAYQEILPLRTDHIDGDTVLVVGVPPGYDPREKAEAWRHTLRGSN
jgi:uncharacterized protein (DUF1330 family)